MRRHAEHSEHLTFLEINLVVGIRIVLYKGLMLLCGKDHHVIEVPASGRLVFSIVVLKLHRALIIWNSGYVDGSSV